MNIPAFIKTEYEAARRRYERLRTSAVLRVAIYPTEGAADSRHTLAYLAIQRERCIEIVGGLDVLMALCRTANEPVALAEGIALSGELWRLANGCELAGLEIRYPTVCGARRAA